MLRVNVGLSRKLSKDYNSTGYSVNIDGEVTTPTSDPEAVMEQVKELFDLAEESLALQIERGQSDVAIGSRDEGQRTVSRQRNGQDSGTNGNGPRQSSKTPNGNANGKQPPQEEEQPATNKQINYLLNIGKRQKLSTAQLERKVAEILGRPVGIYDLTKQAAAVVIDQLANGTGNGYATGRR